MKKKSSTIAGVLALIWMCVIFSFSAQEKEESSAVSEAFSYRVISSSRFFFHLDLDEEELLRIADAIENSVRKAAHMTEFAILSILLYIWIGKYLFHAGKRGFLAVFLTMLYAAGDEIHQRFVPGRAGTFGDVMIDSAGALLGVVVFIGVGRCISFLWNRRRYRETESS
ncbi:MAG: VanZ family protein [Roseburia sp.]|nr:VanZ family protein [Ruminococcus sp.]MCM1153739.1 VanZ family protein [Roseburia sp.]MCM1242184.1 VanZ family protein [Roseburia sp.]